MKFGSNDTQLNEVDEQRQRQRRIAAFEQLKQKLASEGLFDAARKKPLPMLPRVIGVVTSPTGAVIRDILRILRRRFRNINVLLYPVKVQGEGAAQEIAQGVEYFNRKAPVDVMIVARGEARWKTSGHSTRRWWRGPSPRRRFR